MRFFKLTSSKVFSGGTATAQECVRVKVSFRLPGLVCPNCGTWSSSQRLRVTVPEGLLADVNQVSFLPVEEWLRRRTFWAGALRVPAEQLLPGAQLGPPQGEILSDCTEDFLHPFPGDVWVIASVAHSLKDAGFKGLDLARVKLVGKSRLGRAPELFAIVPTGRAWRQGSTKEALLLCDICKRQGFPNPNILVVDRERWDGTDCFILDENPNMIFVTERIRDFIVSHGYSNIAFAEIR
jgi:uncharacterized protein CXXCG